MNRRRLAGLSRVHNILSPLRDDRKPLIFQWAFTLRNAGIGSVSNPVFYTLKNEWLPVVTKRRRYIMNPALEAGFQVCFKKPFPHSIHPLSLENKFVYTPTM